MQNFRLLTILFSLLIFPNVSYGAQQLMGLDELEEMLEHNSYVPAQFYTVPEGTQLKRYDIKIRGVVNQSGLKIIIFTTSYQIAGGMSGSPVYVDGKLVGALAYRISTFSTPSWGGISPIELMIDDRLNYVNNTVPLQNLVYNGMNFSPIPLGRENVDIHGLGNIELETFTQNTTGSSLNNIKLEAGMPIVVDLAYWTGEDGETNTLGAVGTITYIDDDGNVYAFGHPFMDAKKVHYSFRTSSIIGTVESEANSFKLSGKQSDILGIINVDSAYGIYGTTSLDDLGELHEFSLNLSREGNTYDNLDIRIADSIMTPVLASATFGIIGQNYKAPLPHESAVTELNATFNIHGHQTVVFQESFSPRTITVGTQTSYVSSYTLAMNEMLERAYMPLSRSNYNFDISDVDIEVNFISGQVAILKVNSYNISDKLIYQQNLILNIQLVAMDNSVRIDGNMELVIDWDKVEKPIYTIDDEDILKESDKRVNGVVAVYGLDIFWHSLSSSQELELNPNFFFGPDDYLEVVSRRFAVNNQKLFGKIQVRSKGNSNGVSTTQNQKSEVSVDNLSEWRITPGGVKERTESPSSGNVLEIPIEFPTMPSGYIVDPTIREIMQFEVVLPSEK